MWRLIPNHLKICRKQLQISAFSKLLGPQQKLNTPKQLHTGLVKRLQNKLQWSGPQERELVEGFVVKEIEQIPELSLTAVRLEHEKTGADYLHIARDDSNNVFCVAFRTTPMDSTGVPHILEHTTLCGSEKYPCRDPFMKMLNRSLSTFMNAMTGPDYTMYPFSTQNPTDYQNIMNVYLDAVFKPLLRELDFLQEGWRLEHTDPKDASSPIIIKGVVYNEMKGCLCDPHTYLFTKLLNTLLPSHTYGHSYGGDPLHIPALTWEGLRNFHKNYYHPSNSRFYSYGNFNLVDHLKFINGNYLQYFNKLDQNTSVPREESWKEPVEKTFECAFDPVCPDPERQTSICVSHVVGDVTDNLNNLVMKVLSELLMGGPNSPMYKCLIESGLGSAFSPLCGFDTHTRDTVFTIGVQGVKESDVEKVKSVISETINDVIKNGFDKERIDAILHRIELSTKHQTSNFGLNIIMGLTPLWNHEGDPIEALQISKQVLQFRGLLTDPLFFQKTVEKVFHHNPHKLVLVMSPNDTFEANLKEEEKKLLQQKLQQLNENTKQQVLKKGQDLLADQSKPSNVSCLPRLKIADIRTDVDRTQIKNNQIQNVPLQLTHQPTNQVTYFRSIFDAKFLSEEQNLLIPLFCGVVNKMGTKNYTYREQDHLIELKTGGLDVSPIVIDGITDNTFKQGIVLSSYCLDKNIQDMFTLWRDILVEAQFEDQTRFGNLVRETATEIVNGLSYSGHRYCMGSAAAMISSSSACKETMNGLSYIKNIKRISQLEDFTDTLNQMKDIANTLLCRENMRIALNVSESSSDSVERATEDFLTHIPLFSPSKESSSVPFEPQTKNIHYILPLPVYFTAKAIPAVPFTHPDYAPLRIMSKILSSKFLLTEVREKGGAYGSGLGLSTSGVMNFYSYRDPNLSKTFETFERTGEWIKNKSFNEDCILEAKLSVFQEVDAPHSPGSRGMNSFLHGISDDILQEHRLALKSVNYDDIVRVGDTYLNTPKKVAKVCIGPESQQDEKVWEKENL